MPFLGAGRAASPPMAKSSSSERTITHANTGRHLYLEADLDVTHGFRVMGRRCVSDNAMCKKSCVSSCLVLDGDRHFFEGEGEVQDAIDDFQN